MKLLNPAFALAFVALGCVYIPPPPGSQPPMATPTDPAATAAADPAAPQDPAAADAPWGTDEAPAATAEATAQASASVSAPTVSPPAGMKDGANAASVCTRASTCTTAISMELCGILNPKCLDAFHKHADGATKEKCQEKLDRLPDLIAKWGKPGYKLPDDCR